MQPPRLAQALLRAILPPEDAETISGDLDETYRTRFARSSRGAAGWWYWRQVLSVGSARLFARFSRGEGIRRPTMSTVRQDVAYALRSLRKDPGFTAAAVVMLALGIGVNVAIFTLVNAVLLRDLPFARPAELMVVHALAEDREAPATHRQTLWSYPKYEMFRDVQRAFSSVSLFTAWTWNVSGSGTPERSHGELVDAAYFHTLGITPHVGRTFTAEEVRGTDSVRLAIISDRIWSQRFGRSPDAIGRTLNLNGDVHTIVGVLPPGFAGLTGQAELWVPVTTLPAEALGEVWNHSYSVVGRLEAGVSYHQADAATRTLAATIDRQFPRPNGITGSWSATAVPLNAERADPIVRRSVLLLLGAVGAVLLLVCINLANLTLVRALARQRDVAIRLALGAGRGRIVRQLVTECLVLALIGGAVALALAHLLVSAGAGLMPDPSLVLSARGQSLGLTRIGLSSLSVDAGVLLFAAGVAVAAALVFGVAPAWRASRCDLADAIKSGGSSALSGGPRHTAVRNLLAMGELAIALVLLVAAGLFGKSLLRLNSTDLGFRPDGLIAVRVGLHRPALNGARGTQFLEQLIDRLAARPEIAAAAYGNCPPVSGGCNTTFASFPDRPAVPRGSEPSVGVLWASPEYFDTLGIRVLRGRVFTKDDRPSRPKVVVVNQTAARAFWGSESAIGQRIAVGQGGFGDGAEVVGVVADVRYGGVETSVRPAVYLPLLQTVRVTGYLFVRGRVSSDALLPALRAEFQAMDPELPLADVRSMEERFAEATWRTRASAWLLGAFALLAVLLAALGVYGVMTQGVEQRTREIGIRLALGAPRHEIVRLVIRRALLIAGAGTGAGLLLALSSLRSLRALLYEVQPGDPVVLGAIATLLLTVALLASYLPARRATRVDPLRILRTE